MKFRLKTFGSMKRTYFVCLFLCLTTFLLSQSNPVPPINHTGSDSPDLLTVAEANHSLSMFVAAAQFSGLAKMLRNEGPLTVFALNNQAFANLPKDDLEALLTNRAAMHFLLAHYVTHGNIVKDDAASLLSARTIVGVKLRTDIRSEGSYVNGAKLSEGDIPCTNGMIHVLNSFDPGLVHDAVALAKASRRKK
jgi:uncharacterized surface protein with fasciclin (FAS1) repeats